MKKIFLLLLSISSLTNFAQRKYTISGQIVDKASGENLIYANVYDKHTQKGAVSNTYGFYSLTLPEGAVDLLASYVGYQNKNERFYLNKDTLINFRLDLANQLEEVTIMAEKMTKLEKKTQMSQINVRVREVEKIPSLLGEVDVLKTLQLLPGVQGGTEGLNGIYVRGGSPDQNLIILDGVPVYNVSHLMGLLSVFNTDAIKNISLTKGGFPARYGGRLSSVIEINMKEGNKQELHGEGSIGMLSSRLTVEAPIIKDKSSFIISGRRNYIDLIAKPIIKSAIKQSGDEMDLDAYFYDLNAKWNYKLNDKHTLYASAYLGSDIFGMDYTEHYEDEYTKSLAGIDWGNKIGAFRWNYKIDNKLFANTTLTYSNFKFDFLAGREDKYKIDHINSETGEATTEEVLDKFKAKYLSGIRDLAAKVDFDYIPNPNHYVRFGFSDTYHSYNPGALSFKVSYEETEIDTTMTQTRMTSNEYYTYIEDDVSVGAFKANLGLHISGFSVGNTSYIYPQPRLGLRYLISDTWSLKASYASMAQYINLLTNESLSLPTDLWVPSTEKILPQTSWQVALGGATTLKNGIELSLETYYKKMNNVISYKEGSSFYGRQTDWQDKITQGTGTAYGTELLLQKKSGKTTGWLGYTLAWNTRQFDDINNGKPYPFKYDRRHDVELVVSHKFNDRISANATWTFSTGNAITLAEATYIGSYTHYEAFDENGTPIGTGTFTVPVQIYGEKNSYRMGANHRLDIGVEFTKKTSWGERAWTISAYNAYNHQNPFYIYMGRDWENNRKTYKQISLLPIIPAVSYRFKF